MKQLELNFEEYIAQDALLREEKAVDLAAVYAALTAIGACVREECKGLSVADVHELRTRLANIYK